MDQLANGLPSGNHQLGHFGACDFGPGGVGNCGLGNCRLVACDDSLSEEL